jgi:hypothetical protein
MSHLLNRCQGDCDEDSHCGTGLKCFQRNAFEAVPGCTGGEQDATTSDYCIRSEDFQDATDIFVPSSPPTQFVGNLTVVPEPINRPLRLCEGDCDNDDDCEDGLVCWTSAVGDVSIPSCNGPVGTSRTDFCVNSTEALEALASLPTDSQGPSSSISPSFAPTASLSPSLEPTATPSSQPSVSQHPSLIPTESKVPSDVPSLIPTESKAPSAIPTISSSPSISPSVSLSPTASQRPSSSPTVSQVPSVKPSLTPTDNKDPSSTPTVISFPSSIPSGSLAQSEIQSPSSVTKVTNSPSAISTISIPLKDYGATPLSSRYPLSLCEGDCDDDADCAAGLICWQRNAGEDVPGCIGDFSTSSDFCVKSNITAPLIDYLESPPADFLPLRLCEGDCDDDSSCGKGLVCLHREAGDDVPGCSGDFSSSSDFCVWP